MYKLIKLFLAIFIVFAISACHGSEDSSPTIIKMTGEPNIEKIGYGGPSIRDKAKYSDLNYTKSEYKKGDLVLGFFYAMILIQRSEGNEDKKKGVEVLENLWRDGLVDAGYSLSSLYARGVGVKKNIKKSINYLKKSAELGSLESQQKLGVVYIGNDKDIPYAQDYTKAKYWLLKASEQGDKLSAIKLANLYLHGRGVSKSEHAAFNWLKKSAELQYGNNTLGFDSLGKFYEKGIGTDVDLVQAYKYYDLVSPSKNVEKAKVKEKMSDQQYREAQRLSLQWQKDNNTYVGF